MNESQQTLCYATETAVRIRFSQSPALSNSFSLSQSALTNALIGLIKALSWFASESEFISWPHQVSELVCL